MPKSAIVPVLCLIEAILQFFITPPIFAQLTKVKTSYGALTANLTAYWLVKEAKLFEKQGLDVDVVLIESGVTTIQALVAGETQIAMGGGTVAVSSGLAGGDLISIASIENRFPYGLVALKEIKSVEQLKGRRHAISRFGSVSDLGSRLIFQRYGLVPDKDISFLQIGGTSTRLAALNARTVESTILTPEFFLRAKKAGFTILIDPTQYRIDFPQLDVITSRAFAKSRPDIVTRYLRAIVEGIHLFKNDREASIRAMSKYLRIQDREALEETYRIYREIYQPIPFPSPAAIQTQLTSMAQRDPRAKEAKPEQFMDPTFLKEIEKSGFVAKLYQK